MEKKKKLKKPGHNPWINMSQENKDKLLAQLRAHQYKPGQSGNPTGAGTYTFDRALRDRLRDPQIRAKLVEVTLNRALAGDHHALKMIAERTGGALAPNVLAKEMEEAAGESNSRTVLFNDEEEAQELQPAMQAENDEDEE